MIADAATRIHVELVKVHHVGTGCLRAELIFLAWCAAKIGRLLTRAPKRSREAEILSVLPLRASASLSAFYGVGGRVFHRPFRFPERGACHDASRLGGAP